MKTRQLLMKFNTVNQNGRMYTKDSLMPYLKDDILGGIGYDQDSIINLKNVSHKVSNLTIENDELWGDIEILDTKEGELLKTIINEVVFRPKGVGEINEKQEVVNYSLISFDAVSKDKDAF